MKKYLLKMIFNYFFFLSLGPSLSEKKKRKKKKKKRIPINSIVPVFITESKKSRKSTEVQGNLCSPQLFLFVNDAI